MTVSELSLSPDQLELNCRAIFSEEFSNLKASDSGVLQRKGVGGWLLTFIYTPVATDPVTEATLATLKQIKEEMSKEQPIWFFAEMGYLYNFTYPYAEVAKKVLNSPLFKQDEKVQGAARAALEAYESLDFGVKVGRDLTEGQSRSLNRFIRARGIHAFHNEVDQERKMRFAAFAVNEVEEQILENKIWDRKKATYHNLDWVLSGEWEK